MAGKPHGVYKSRKPTIDVTRCASLRADGLGATDRPQQRLPRAGECLMTFIEAKDLALRYHCKLPDYHENHPKAALWIAAIAELPLAEQQGRLGAATREADRLAQ